MSQTTEACFGGIPKTPDPEVFANARRNNPLWYQMLEKAYASFVAKQGPDGPYSDPKGNGATLQQAWLVFTLYGIEQYCLLAGPAVEGQYERITRLVKMSPTKVVETLKEIRRTAGRLCATTLHHDGYTGHCITIFDYDQDRDRFIYHDPWPEKSLLCRENNLAQVDAQPEENRRWSISSAELTRVIYASFVFPADWTRLQGVQFDHFFDDWKQSDFFGRFCLRELEDGMESDVRQVMFAPGAFRDQVRVITDVRSNGKISNAMLFMDKTWMIRNLGLAFDISRRFIISFAPAPDAETFRPIADTIRGLKNPQFAVTIKDRDPESAIEVKCVHALMGSADKADLGTDLSHLYFENTSIDGTPFQKMTFALY